MTGGPRLREQHDTHRYTATCSWRGSTAVGYEAYDRRHEMKVPSVSTPLALSSDPAFRGDPSLLNPEQLLLLAASSCQLLSFLAAASRARVDVIAYHDEAEAVMPEDDPPTRITAIVLRPRVSVRGPVAEERVRHLIEVGHRECYIANSVRSEITIEPTIEIVDAGSDRSAD